MEIKKALTFRASSIGDCLMGKYLLENVHAAYPEAKLGIIVGSRVDMIRELFSDYPWLEVIGANRRHPAALFRLWRDWRGSDLIVTQYAGKPGGRFSFASKLAARVLAKRGGLSGFTDASPVNNLIYDQLLPFDTSMAIAEHERAVLRAAGIPVAIPFPILTSEVRDAILEKFELTSKKYVIAHFFAGGKGRSMSPKKCREVLLALRQALPIDTEIVVSGGKDDREIAQEIAQGVDVRVFAGKATLYEMLQLIKGSRSVVSVDTGIAHIAVQLGARLIVMRTCLGRQWWLPEQYGSDAPITIFERDDLCVTGHVYGGYAPCFEGIDASTVSRGA